MSATKLKTSSARCDSCGGTGKIRTAAPETLRAHRVAAGLGLREFARQQGFSAAYVSDLERGNRRPTPKIIAAYASLRAAA